MNPKVKLVLYVVLGGCLLFFGSRVLSLVKEKPADATSVPTPTNRVAATNLVVTNAAAAVGTNEAITTNAAPAASAAAEVPEELTPRRSSARLSRIMGYGSAAFLALVGLSILIGQDMSRFFANRVDDFIFNDDLEGVKDPDYEEAEDTWRKGDHLGAIRLMRDYLKKHPREQYVALRIAEIYETDLRNYLAAALEYEEILKKKLPPERWGWAAIHLANLYSGKLNKMEEAEALLHRIVKEFGQTAAAKKARERLGIPEPLPIAEVRASLTPTPEPVSAESAPEESNLPPGFRPKK